jgi:hypothetical protein
MPPRDSVTHTGSPENSALYSGRAQEAHDAPLDDEVVDDLLRLLSVSVPSRRSRSK